MKEEFLRTKELIGEKNLEKLKNTRIAVFGIGGVGGYVVEALVRSGIGKIDIVDNDCVSISNINRQIIAGHSTIGRPKVDVMKERAIDINPDIQINTFNILYLPDTANQFDFKKYDYIVDAIDNVTGKIELVLQAQQAGTPIISAMGAGNKLNPLALEVCDIYKTSVCPLAKVMRHELKKRNVKKLKVVYSKEPPIKNTNSCERTPSSMMLVPSCMGVIIASQIIKDILA